MSKRAKADCADVTDVLHELDSGTVHQQLDDMLHEVVRAVQDTKKAGSVSLKIDVKLNERGTMLVVKGTVSSKIPRTAAESTLFFGTEHGDLSRDDPKQMNLRNITAPTQPDRTVREPAGDIREVGKKLREALVELGEGTVVSAGFAGDMHVLNPKGGDQ